ncbi:MAG: hypothetical protein ABSB94_18120 [Syntrophorhabdales bacterium]|jgi:hypothetical protein
MKVLKVLLCGSLLLMACSLAVEAGPPLGTGPPETVNRSQAQPQTPGAQSIPRAPEVSPVTQMAVNLGVLSCASRINQVVNFLGGSGQETGAFIFTPPAQPDQSMFSVSMEVPGGGGDTAYATATFAPNQANGCGALYETVAYWPLTCNEVERKYFPGMARLNQVRQNITALGGPSPARVFLMRAGTGCVTIKKEIVR